MAALAEAKFPEPIICSEEGCTATTFERWEHWDETQQHTLSTAPGRYDDHAWAGLNGEVVDSDPWKCLGSKHGQDDDNEELLGERS